MEHAKVCETCLKFRKAKSRAEGVEHSEIISNLNPMDQVSTDLLEVPKDKSKFVMFIDRASGFVQGEKLKGTS